MRGLGPIALAFLFFAGIGTDGFRHWPSLPGAEPCEAGGGKPDDEDARGRPLTAAEITFLAIEGADQASRGERDAPCATR